jgi:hypothetical protein
MNIRVIEDRYEMESFHKPTTKPSSHPTTTKAVATTQPADPQLQQALTTMIGLIVLHGDHVAAVPAGPASGPVARPLKSIPEPAPDDATPRTKPETRPLDPRLKLLPDNAAPAKPATRESK